MGLIGGEEAYLWVYAVPLTLPLGSFDVTFRPGFSAFVAGWQVFWGFERSLQHTFCIDGVVSVLYVPGYVFRCRLQFHGACERRFNPSGWTSILTQKTLTTGGSIESDILTCDFHETISIGTLPPIIGNPFGVPVQLTLLTGAGDVTGPYASATATTPTPGQVYGVGGVLD